MLRILKVSRILKVPVLYSGEYKCNSYANFLKIVFIKPFAPTDLH